MTVVEDLLDTDEKAEQDYAAWLSMLKNSAHLSITMKELAELIKAASRIHEESYVKNDRPELMVGYYTITLSDACSIACRDVPHIEVIIMLMVNWWNDANMWADGILGVVSEQS